MMEQDPVEFKPLPTEQKEEPIPFEPIEFKPIGPPNLQQDIQSGVNTVMDKANTPLVNFQKPSGMAEDPSTLGNIGRIGFGLLESQSTPLTLGITAATAGGMGLAKAGMPNAGKNVLRLGKVLAAPGAIQGAYKISQGNVLEGAPELLASAAALKMKVPEGGFRGTVAPEFNTAATGATGKYASWAPGTRITLANTEPEYIKQLVKEGFGPGGVDELGRGYMVKLDKPLGPPPMEDVGKPSMMHELYNASRGLMSVDLPFMTSAAFRQAAPLAGTKQWFQGWNRARLAYGDQKLFDAQMDAIEKLPLFKDGVDVSFGGQGFKVKRVPSFAQQAGLRMTGLKSFSGAREENLSQWIEKLPGYGRHIKASNRAYTAFLNHVRAETFNSMVKNMGAENNLPLAKQIAEFVNDATGRGTMRIGPKSLEQSTKILSDALFSPRNFFARTNMLEKNVTAPFGFIKDTYGDLANFVKSGKYNFTPQHVRLAYLKSGFRVASTWLAMATLAKQAGAEVSLDPTNADFGKMKIGNTRIDPGAGFQQFLVLAARMATSEITSSTTNITRGMGESAISPTGFDVGFDFMANKAHPTLKLLIDVFRSQKDRPVFIGDKLTQMVLPMFVGDLYELYKEDPQLVPWMQDLAWAMPASNVGLGVSTYDKTGFKKPTFDYPTDVKMEGYHPSQWKIQERR